MALKIVPDQRVTIWDIKDEGKFAQVRISSSRKDKRIEDPKRQWINTSWFARFIGEAHNKIGLLTKGARIELTNSYIAQEPYEKDGEKQYPKAPQVIVFDFALLTKGKDSSGGMDNPPEVEEEIPW